MKHMKCDCCGQQKYVEERGNYMAFLCDDCYKDIYDN